MKTLWRLKDYSFRYGWRLAISYLCMLVGLTMVLTIPMLIGTTIDDILESGLTSTAAMMAVVILALGIGRGVLRYIQNWMSESAAHMAVYDLRNDYYHSLLNSSFHYHGQQRVGQMMSIGTSDIEAVQQFMSMGILQVVNMFVFMGIVVGVMLAIDWQLALISLAGLYIWLFRAYQGRIAGGDLWERVQRRTAGLTTILQESLVSIKIVRAFGIQQSAISRFERSSGALSDELYEAHRYHTSRAGTLYAIYGVGLAVMLWYGMNRISAGEITPGHLATFILLLEVYLEPFRAGLHHILSTYRVIAAGERVLSAMDAAEIEQDAALIDGQMADRVSGPVEFEGVSAEYERGVPVVHDLRFEIRPDELVVILGAAASGKSTIANLIPRFYEISEGRITVDGQDTRDIPTPVLRRSVGIVLQDPFMFAGTIRDNIAFGRSDAGMDEIEEAARIAHIHDFVSQLPLGYETVIGERGITLSGGQRQRISIARVVVQNPPILIFDDSTSNVDFETEHQIQEALSRISSGKSTLIVTHRVSTARIADRILVLDGGRIVEQGRYEDLLHGGGHFAHLHDIQSATLIEDVLVEGAARPSLQQDEF